MHSAWWLQQRFTRRVLLEETLVAALYVTKRYQEHERQILPIIEYMSQYPFIISSSNAVEIATNYNDRFKPCIKMFRVRLMTIIRMNERIQFLVSRSLINWILCGLKELSKEY